MKHLLRAVVAAAALALSTTVLAAAQDMPSQQAPAGAARAHAHRFADAIHSLSLSSDQQSRIDELHRNYKAQQKGITDKNQRRANRRAFHKAVLGVLSPDQRAQLKSAMHQGRTRPPSGEDEGEPNS